MYVRLYFRSDLSSPGGQRSSRGQNALWLTNLCGKNPCPERSALLGSNVMQGQLGSARGQIA